MRRYGLMVITATLTLGGCAKNPAGPGQGNAANLAFTPSNPGPGFVPAATVAEQQTLSQEIWAVLSAPNCWDASAIVQAAQPVGNVAQFQFFSGNQYRHFGFSINFGAVLLHQVGRYHGLRTAIVETWTGEIEALVVVDSQEIAHVFPHLSGAITVLRYGRSSGPCL